MGITAITAGGRLFSALCAFALQDKANITIIFLVMLASVIAGVMIANFAKMKGYMEGRTTQARGISRADESLQSALVREISKLPLPADDREQAREAISNIVAEELDNKMNLARQQLDEKYKIALDESKQTAEIVKRKYEKLNMEKKQTEAVIRSIAEGLVVVNEKGEVLLMNPAAEKLLGVQKEKQIGKSILNELKDEQLISLVTKSADEDREGMEIVLRSSEDETKKVLRASSAVIENEYGKTVGMVSMLSDVTKQKELDQLKADFVSKVSHELRTPIITVQNAISLLLTNDLGSLTRSQEKFLNIAQRNLKRLSLLIDDLLELSKLEAVKVKMKFSPCSLEKIINEVCAALSSWARAKAIKIEKKISPDTPEINLDANRIIQVLNNIVGNAVKFTPRNGRITIQAGLDAHRKNVLLSVADTGPGIAREDLGKVFDKFQQVGERVSTDISGTGLGLAIAKEIIELHKGKIWAESEKGQGAKFTFTLPVVATQVA